MELRNAKGFHFGAEVVYPILDVLLVIELQDPIAILCLFPLLFVPSTNINFSSLYALFSPQNSVLSVGSFRYLPYFIIKFQGYESYIDILLRSSEASDFNCMFFPH